MSEEAKAVAGEVESESKTTVETKGAQDNLDELLSAFDQEFTKAIPEQKAAQQPVANDDVSQLRSQVDYLVTQMTSGDIEKAVDSLAHEMGEDVSIPKRAIKGMLNDMAIEDLRLRRAFENRHNDPTSWKKVLKGAANAIRKEFSNIPDKKVNEDRSAIAAAVRGASKTKVDDEAPDFRGWSDQRFNHWKMYGKDNPNL